MRSLFCQNMSDAVFDECDVTGATLRSRNFNEGDRRGADWLVLDPEEIRIQKASSRSTDSTDSRLRTKYQLDVSKDEGSP